MKLTFRFVLLLSSIGLTACTTMQKPVSSKNPAETIRWPAEYEPSQAAFYVSNQIAIAAPPQVVWDLLIQAETWPQWYEGAANVNVQNSSDGILKKGSVFTWRTMDMTFTSVVKEYEPPFRLAWESRKAVIQGYHAWLIVPTPEGCRVVTDESFHGFLGTMQRIFLPNKLRRLHDVFLEGLKAQAEAKVAGTSGK
jgi:uncharacterized protein YndB with AHSA1/START domain